MRLSVVCLAAAVIVLPEWAAAEGVWFDVGSGQSTTLSFATSPTSSVTFPPYPFGIFPPGSLAYVDVSTNTDPNFPTAYSFYFSDGGCGCGGDLRANATCQFRYDASSLTGSEENLHLYRKTGYNWELDPTAVQDSGQDLFSASLSGNILGTRLFAIGFTAPTAVETTTWGGIKVLYRGR